MLNTEGDDDEMSKSSNFAKKIDLEPIDHPNYIHGAFVGDRSSKPDSFKQFGMEYIPHISVLNKEGKFLGNKVDTGSAVNVALQKKSEAAE